MSDSGQNAACLFDDDIFGDDVEEELPSQLDLGDRPPGSAGTPLLEELPLSQGSAVAPATVECSAEASVGALVVPEAPPPIAIEQHAGAEGVGQVAQASIFARRGRPSRALQEAMRRAVQDQPPDGADGQSLALEQGRALRLVAQRQDAERLALHKQARQRLLRDATLDEIEERSLLKRPVGGIVPLSPAGPSTLAAVQLAALPGERLDEEVLNIGRELLDDVPSLVSSKRARSAAFGVPEAKLSSAQVLLGSATALLDRVGRSMLEKELASVLGDVGLLLYLDAVAYDETPLQESVRSDNLPPVPDSTALVATSLAQPNDMLHQPGGIVVQEVDQHTRVAAEFLDGSSGRAALQGRGAHGRCSLHNSMPAFDLAGRKSGDLEGRC